MRVPQSAIPAPLEAGYRRFREGRYAHERERYRELGERGQSPAALVVACSDSRSGPETVFDAFPGELFVVRNVAALVPAYAPDAGRHGASAALEYGVLALGIPSIVVMGHGRCGGIKAAIHPSEPLSTTDFVGAWVAGIRELAAEVDATPRASRDAGHDDRDGDDGARETDPRLLPASAPVQLDDPARLRAIELRSVERSIANLRTFPWIASREASGDLSLHGAWFDISLGELHVLGAGRWERLEAR